MNGPCSACGDGDKALKYHSHDVRDPRITVTQGRMSERQLYDSDEIERLTAEYSDGLESNDCGKLAVQATMLAFVRWLKAQEVDNGTA